MEATPSSVAARLSARRIARVAVLVLAATVPGLLLVQVYLAGAFLMGGEDMRAAHVGLGRALQFYPALLLLAGLIARMPRRFWMALAALWVALVVQAWLPLLSASGPTGLVRALHPLVGFALLGLSVNLYRVARSPETNGPDASAPGGQT